MDSGLSTVLRNLDAQVRRMMTQAEAAADESAQFLESFAKATAPFQDHTTNLRNSIKGTYRVTDKSAQIVLSAGMEYAPHVEFGHGNARAFPFIWPTVQENAERVRGIFARRLKV